MMLGHQSGVNTHGDPFVQLILDGRVICQLTPKEARDHAQAILEAAEASEQDAFMLNYVTKIVGPDVAMGVLVDFRKWREARGKEGPPSDAAKFIKKHGGREVTKPE